MNNDKVMLLVRVPQSTRQQLKIYAAMQNVSMCTMIERAVEMIVKAAQQERAAA